VLLKFTVKLVGSSTTHLRLDGLHSGLVGLVTVLFAKFIYTDGKVRRLWKS